MARSKVGDKILVGLIPLKGRMLISPDELLGEVYFPDNWREFANTCSIGEIWSAEVLSSEAIKDEAAGSEFIYRVMLKLLARDEIIKGRLDRASKEWIVERTSGIHVLSTHRIPARIFQKKKIKGSDIVTVERIVNKETGEILSEYEAACENKEVLRARELEQIKRHAVLRHR